MERNATCSQTITQKPKSEFDGKLWPLESKPFVGYSTENKNALHDAILQGKSEYISELIKKEKDAENSSGSSSETPFQLSTRLECQKPLIKHGGSLTNEDGISSTHLAVIQGQDKITRWLINNRECVNIANSKGITPLVHATWYGYTNLVQTLVEIGANVNYHTSCLNNATPLHIAVWRDKEDVIKTLSKSGADPTLFCSCNQTPVHWASVYGNLQSLKILDTYGADLSVQMNDETGYQPIHLAAGSGHTSLVEWFLGKGISVECPSRLGFTPLHLAVVSGQMTTVKFLLKMGAQVDRYINANRNTLLHVAASDGNLLVIQSLLDLGADANADDAHQYTPAHHATRKNHVPCLKRLLNVEGCKRAHPLEPLIITAARNDSEDAALWLLEYGEWTEVRCKYGMTALHHATLNDSRNVAFLLICRGADVNSKDNNLLSPLHYAVLKGHTDIGILLSASKADLHAETKEQMTPLHLAAMKDQLEFLKLLIFQGGNILVPSTNTRRDYPIHIAAAYESENVLQWMLDCGVSVNIANALGYTPLFNVSRVGNVMMAKLLLDRGADVNVRVAGEDCMTCLHAACLNGSVKMVTLLLQNGANPEASTSTDMWTPLHWAVIKGHLEVTKILVKFGANVSARNKFGLAPINLALMNGHGKIVDFLAVTSVTKCFETDAL